MGMFRNLSFVGCQCRIDVGKTYEILATVNVEISAYGLQSVVSVESEGLGFEVVLLVEQFLVECGIIDTVVPQVVVAVDG